MGGSLCRRLSGWNSFKLTKVEAFESLVGLQVVSKES